MLREYLYVNQRNREKGREGDRYRKNREREERQKDGEKEIMDDNNMFDLN